MSSKARALVVLAHGFCGHRIQMIPLANTLRPHHHVLNYAYRSRRDTLEGHASALIDALHHRLRLHSDQKPAPSVVHFVTHSYGGLVLHRAFAQGLHALLPESHLPTRCVLIAPPLRGARLARMFHRDNVIGPRLFRSAVATVAETVLGEDAGRELMNYDSDWFDRQLNVLPSHVHLLVVAGTLGLFNPLLARPSDGVVTLDETFPRRTHSRLHVPLSHNLLLYSPTVRAGVRKFLEGASVGQLDGGLIHERTAVTPSHSSHNTLTNKS